MNATPIVNAAPRPVQGASSAQIGRLLVAGTVAGGILLGGFAVGGMTAMGRLSGHAWMVNAMALFLVGSLAGAVPATALALLGRPTGLDLAAASRTLAKAVLFLVPALAVSAVITGWIAMARVAVYLGSGGLLAGVVVAWLLGFAVLVWATCEGTSCLRNALRRGRA